MNSWVSFFIPGRERDFSFFYCGVFFSLNIMLLYTLHQKYGCGGKRKQGKLSLGICCFWCPVGREPISTPWVAEAPRSRKLFLASIPLYQKPCCPYSLGLCQAELKDSTRVKGTGKIFSLKNQGRKFSSLRTQMKFW